MRDANRFLFAIMPFLFGLGFVAPVLMQTGVTPYLGGRLSLDPLWLALLIGGGWGASTCLRGRWT